MDATDYARDVRVIDLYLRRHKIFGLIENIDAHIRLLHMGKVHESVSLWPAQITGAIMRQSSCRRKDHRAYLRCYNFRYYKRPIQCMICQYRPLRCRCPYCCTRCLQYNCGMHSWCSRIMKCITLGKTGLSFAAYEPIGRILPLGGSRHGRSRRINIVLNHKIPIRHHHYWISMELLLSRCVYYMYEY